MMIIILATLNSFIFTLIAIPSIIKVANIKHLYDEPDKVRKKHRQSVPTLGGLAIFAGTVFSVTFWCDQRYFYELQYIISSLLIIFYIGIKDDIIALVHWKKLLSQVFAAIILVQFAQIRVTNLYGILGINELSTIGSYIFTTFFIITITNAYNLIDGIDCLAGVLACISSFFFGIWLYLLGDYQYSILAFCLLGSLVAFLIYNKTPARIFMGDTGSLIVGIVTSILVVHCIDGISKASFFVESNEYCMLLFLGVLFIPIIDLFSVFLLRLLRKKSPLLPDRSHIHHLLVESRFSHIQSTLMLALVTLLIISIIYFFYFLKINSSLLQSFLLFFFFAQLVFRHQFLSSKK